MLRSLAARRGRPLGVRQRLWLGVGSLVALLLLLACGAVWQLREMSGQLHNIVQGHGQRGELAHRLHAAQLKWMERLRALLVVSDAEDLKAQLAELKAAERDYLDAETALGAALRGGGASDAMRSGLAEVLRLRESVAAMWEAGVTDFVELGGKVLGPMIKRIAPDATVRSVVTMDDVEAALGAF